MTTNPTPAARGAELLPVAKVEREEIFRITLCGSTRFRSEYELWNRRLSMAGFVVYSVSCFGHSGDPLSDEEKQQLDRVHLAKIDASHAVVVINPGGYIGASTRREIEHAQATGKPVYYLEGGRTVYQLRTGPGGPSSLRYRAFDALPTTPPAEPSAVVLGEIRAALEPFEQALVDYGDDPRERDVETCWEHPIGSLVTIGHFRRAAEALRLLDALAVQQVDGGGRGE